MHKKALAICKNVALLLMYIVIWVFDIVWLVKSFTQGASIATWIIQIVIFIAFLLIIVRECRILIRTIKK